MILCSLEGSTPLARFEVVAARRGVTSISRHERHQHTFAIIIFNEGLQQYTTRTGSKVWSEVKYSP